MATQDLSIEEQAAYRPDISTNILNLITGGLYGGVTGQLERQAQSERARRLLQQEQLQQLGEERQFDRALRRQKISEALKFGIPIPENVGQMGLQEVGSALDEAINRKRIENLRQQLRGLTQQEPAQGIPEGELKGMLQRAETNLSQETARQLSGTAAKSLLSTLQQRGAYPFPTDVSKMTPEQAIAEAKVAEPAYKQSIEVSAADRQKKREDEAIIAWKNEINSADPDENKLSQIFNNLPREFQKEPEIRAQVKFHNSLSPADRKNIKMQREAYQTGANIAESFAKLVGTKDYAEVSQLNFNQLANWKRDQGQKLFTQSPQWAAVDDLLQQAEEYAAGRRKDLFGASLTGNEERSALRLFADPNKANFIPRLLSILDRQFQKDYIAEEYTANQIYVPEAQKKLFQDARDRFNKVRPLLQSAILGDVREEAAAAPAGFPQGAVPAARTAAPTQLSLEQIDAAIKAEREKLERIKAQK